MKIMAEPMQSDQATTVARFGGRATAAKALMALRVVGDLCRIGFGCGEMAGKHQNIIQEDKVATSQDVLAQCIHGISASNLRA
jgi:hypothetical protein